MRNSEDFSSEPDYQAINSRLIGKPVLSSYLNAREYTPKYEDDEAGQTEEGYSRGTDYQALNSRLIGKPVLSSYLSGGRYIPKDEDDRTKYVFELIANSDYFREIMDFLAKRDKDDPNAPKMAAVVSAAFAGFYPEKIPEDKEEKDHWDAEWEKRKQKYLKYLDIPTRAYFFPDMTKEQVLSADEIPEYLERLMRRPYFRAAASLLGKYLNDEGYVTFPDNKMVVSKKGGFNKAAFKDFLTRYYYPNVANWSRQVKSELNKRMKPGDDRKEKLEEVKRELREKVDLSKAAAAISANAEKEAKEIRKNVAEFDKEMRKLSSGFESTDFQDLLKLVSEEDYLKKQYSTLSNITGTFASYRDDKSKSKRGAQAVNDIEQIIREMMRRAFNRDERHLDLQKNAKTFLNVKSWGLNDYVAKLRAYARDNRKTGYMKNLDDAEKTLKKQLETKAMKPMEAVLKKEKEKRQATVKKIKDTRAKNKEAAKKEETTTVDEEKPASEKATIQKTKKGRAATKRVASSTTGTKSRPKVGSAALGAKTPTKKGTRSKNSASTNVTLPASVSPPSSKVRGKKSASPGNKKRVTTGKKKSVPASAALPPPPPPPAEESSSTAALPTEEGQGKKRAGTPPTVAPPRKKKNQGS